MQQFKDYTYTPSSLAPKDSLSVQENENTICLVVTSFRVMEINQDNMHLAQCLTHSKHPINIAYFYYSKNEG
jgi:hypothetical protein